MDAVLAAAGSAHPVVKVDTRSVPGQHWTSSSVTLTAEIRVECLPGGLVTAFPTYMTSDGPISVDPPLVLDPSSSQAGLALITEIERLFARVGGNLDAWQIRAAEPRVPTGLPADEPWLERPSNDAILERLRAVRTGRGGVVAFAIVEAPRWVVRLSVGGRPGDLRVRGRLVDRLVRIDRSHADAPPRWHGDWRLQGGIPDPSRMLDELTEAILARAPEAAALGGPTTAVRLERNASASSAAESPARTAAIAWLVGTAVAFVALVAFAPTTGFFGSFAEAQASGVGIVVVTLVGVIPAMAAGKVSGGIAERWRVRWSVERSIRRAATAGTYAAWLIAMSLLPSWGALLAVTLCGVVGWAVVVGARRRRARSVRDLG